MTNETTNAEPLPSITVQGVGFEWDVADGLMRVFDMPTLALWIGSTVAGLMSGMQRMVGTERFNLALHRDSAHPLALRDPRCDRRRCCRHPHG